MSVRLVILGLLREKPLYGYEIKQIIEEHMNDWTSIAFGSIYFALDKLTEEKFVEKIGVEQPGKRPSRSVYQITDSGRDEFLQLLRNGWNEVEREFFAIDICLFFLDSLPREEVIQYLQQRIQIYQATLTHLQEHRTEQMSRPEVPALARTIFDHSQAHIQTEFNWLTDLLENIRAGSI